MRGKEDISVNYGKLSQSDEDTKTELVSSLLAPDPEDLAKPTTAVPMMEIVAPATLMEGYQLDTELENGQIMTVTIPPGGVEKGQTFSVPMVFPSNSFSSGINANNINNRMNVPVGHWRDGLFNCFRYGLCHASLCTSCWCHALAAGQVISRLELNWLGRPTQIKAEQSSAFTTLFAITMVYLVGKVIIFAIVWSEIPVDKYPASSQDDMPDNMVWWSLLNDVINYSYFLFSVVVIRNVRLFVRKKYAIPEQEGCSTGCEDACCACFCPCLTVAQLQRHTTDYDTYRAEFWSETGLPPHVPALIV